MVTAIEDLLRLAWRADGDEKPGLRDALLTLAVADSGAEDAVLAERCRRLLVARRPDHWFATAPTLGHALAHPRVAAALGRLRAAFPPVRVQRHLLRYAAQGGPFTGRPPSMARVMEDLSLVPEEGRPSSSPSSSPSPRPGAVSRDRLRALPFAAVARPEGDDPDGALAALYLSVLLAMAVLLKTVIDPAAHDSRAA